MNQSELNHKYLGRSCWQTSGFKTIKTGKIRELRKTDNGWVEGHVVWETKNGSVLENNRSSWERITDLGFQKLGKKTTEVHNPTKQQSLSKPSNSTTEDCQGITDWQIDASTSTSRLKRSEQSEDTNCYINYRALLAMIDDRRRDDTHWIQLNETLKREHCNTVTLPAFKMRVNKFSRSFYRSSDNNNTTVLVNFLSEAFNGNWHGSVNKDSIWQRF